MNKFIKILLNYQFNNGLLPIQKKGEYNYAYTILFEECINLALAIAIGNIFDNTFLIIIFLCAYIPFRIFAGGFHAENGIRCGCVSIIILITLVFLYSIETSNKVILFKFLMLILSQIGIFFLAPVDSENKRLSNQEKKNNGKFARKILVIQICAIVGGIIIENRQVYFGISYAHIVLNGMLIIGHCKNYRLSKKIMKMQ